MKKSCCYTQCLILEKGIMIPIDTFASQSANADKDCNVHLSIEEINNYLKSFRSSPYEILKSLVIHIRFWLTFLYVVAGVTLIVGAHRRQEIPRETIANMHFVVNICYFVNSRLFVFPYPLKEWKVRKEVERIRLDFVDTVFRDRSEQSNFQFQLFLVEKFTKAIFCNIDFIMSFVLN